MTPDQIKAKIKELGMNEKEAEVKANALGVDLQKYLDIQAAQQKLSSQRKLKERGATCEASSSGSCAVPQLPDSVPGFEGRTGVAKLQPYGYNLFQYPTSTFEPVLNMPTPSNYNVRSG